MTASLRCKVAMQIGAAECDLNEPTTVCAYDRAEVEAARFRDQLLDVAARLAQVGVAYAKIQMADDDGADRCAQSSGKLGPVFCKVGQTMATRPDIIGLETSRNLGKLQDAMAPEADGPAVAMKTLSDALGGDLSAFFTSISPEPVAAASLAEVYKGTTTDGVEVAIKIQRPGLERKVALDFYVLQQALALAQKQFKIGKDVEQIVAVLDEVGNGIFSELDFTIEAQNILRFERTYAAQLRNLGVVVPAVRQELSSARVLVTEWIDGVPPRDLEANARQALAKTAVRCLAMQLMTDGFIHCDPHEGNLLALPDGRVALLDFGLMASMQTNHQEAMAHGVLNIMAESKCCTHLIPVDPLSHQIPNPARLSAVPSVPQYRCTGFDCVCLARFVDYEALEDVFKGMGVLSTTVDDLRRPGTEEPFSVAIRRCMTGEAAEEARQLKATSRGARRSFRTATARTAGKPLASCRGARRARVQVLLRHSKLLYPGNALLRHARRHRALCG